jgi:quinol monooxygenase YgiN
VKESAVVKLCTLIGTVVAKDETREELRKILADQVAPTRSEPGCVNYDFHVDVKDPNVFVFYENWRGREDLEAHLKAPHLKPLFGRLQELLARPLEMRFLDMLSDPAS